jgi:sulfur relay (sulfurtransferase) DsrC/TusE family protein
LRQWSEKPSWLLQSNMRGWPSLACEFWTNYFLRDFYQNRDKFVTASICKLTKIVRRMIGGGSGGNRSLVVYSPAGKTSSMAGLSESSADTLRFWIVVLRVSTHSLCKYWQLCSDG